MRIVSPIDRTSEALPLIKAGANEFYCGVLDKAWVERYTYLATSDSRNDAHSHLRSIDELKEVVSIAHLNSVRVYLTVNDVMYTKKQYNSVLCLIEKALACGIDGIIIADVALLVRLREIGFNGKIHISLRGTTFNSDTVKFYMDLGCARINLTEDLTVAEIKNIVKKACYGVEFETVVLNGKCANVCGFCSFHHGIDTIIKKDNNVFDLACFKKFDISLAQAGVNDKLNRALCANVKPRDRNFSFTHCGACALWDFRQIGVISVKIVGRGFPTEKKVKDILYLHSCLDLIEKDKLSREEFLNTVAQKYSKIYKGNCKQYCYYYTDYHN